MSEKVKYNIRHVLAGRHNRENEGRTDRSDRGILTGDVSEMMIGLRACLFR